eukprot:TRINITY_DN9253_c0_g1_i3.p1 TRINITY_DN9253_c0_g1~~TRINITY_DN9253_c0_g1_i3.p1  ORF type:complete len:110 (-),score=16.47 TRINITY_DN9253_c0_g1_i3:349-678(-)
MATTEAKKCRRHGCKKTFVEIENSETSCRHHSGKPMFHDTKKGWTCCNQVAYDWDEFEQLAPCSIGRHTDIDPMKLHDNQDAYFKSQTVATAQRAIDRQGQRNRTFFLY